MCYYKRTRYSCNHSSFTIRLRKCHVGIEHKADPKGVTPCDVKEPHPFHTISVSTKCVECRRMDGMMKKLKTELGAIKESIENLEEARGLAKERLGKRLQKQVEEERQKANEGAGLDKCKTRAADTKNALDLEKDTAGEHLETWLREAHRNSSELGWFQNQTVDMKEETECEENSQVPGGEGGGRDLREVVAEVLENIRSSW